MVNKTIVGTTTGTVGALALSVPLFNAQGMSFILNDGQGQYRAARRPANDEPRNR